MKIFIRHHNERTIYRHLYSCLVGIKFKVPSFLFYQLLMSPAFDYRAMLNDQYLISLPDGTQTVGNDEGRPSAHQASQAFLNERFTLCIQIGRCLIQKKYFSHVYEKIVILLGISKNMKHK